MAKLSDFNPHLPRVEFPIFSIKSIYTLSFLEENASLFPAKSHPILACLVTKSHFFYFSPTTVFCCDALHPFYALLPRKLKKRATIFKIPIAILKKLCYNEKNQAGPPSRQRKGACSRREKACYLHIMKSRACEKGLAKVQENKMR